MVQIVPLDEIYPTVHHMLPASEASIGSESSRGRQDPNLRDMYLERDMRG